MKIKIYTHKKDTNSNIKELENYYLKQLKGSSNIELINLHSNKLKSLPDKELVRKEADILLDKIDKDDFLVALDENAKELSSIKFSNFINEKKNSSISISFAIGGVNGFHQSVKDRASLLISLSKMTFTAEMTRLILIEQIYRSHKIISGSSYHKAGF
ncbi:UNVERIFIED_CONTAM: hypothetical protein GTU68_022232 [Idotea baltica]|nr:hypothetical protein [Idotea baltica]